MVPAAGLAGLVVAALLVIPAVRANPGVLLGVFPQFPTQVTVGAANVAATIEAINGSDGAEATGPITVTDLTLIPSCGNFAANCAGGADPGVFQLGSTGTGQAGTGCAGRGFTITVIDAGTGKVRFSPTDGQPFLLGQTDITTELDRCLIAFTFSVLKVPTIDTLPGDPGVSTNQIGFISGSHSGGATGSDQGEDVTTVLGGVGPVTPTLTTQASPGVQLGLPIFDVATLANGNNPTGTVAFSLYGPNDATCSGAAIFSASTPASGNGQYQSGNFTPTQAGTYRWIASYSGDAGNNAVTSPCNAPNESVVVTGVQPVTPTLTTQASPSVALGGFVSDTATLAQGNNPSGTITFRLYGPNDATCATAAVFTNTKTVAGNGGYPSDTFTPTLAGTYRWVASYSGDAGNTAVTTTCNDPNETVTITGAPAPQLTTQASPGVSLGGPVTDTATLAGATNPTGTITFNLYGPNDATCATAAVFTNMKTVTGNGQYTSDPFTPTLAGTYRWTAVYSGDANNVPLTNPCNAANESVVVSAVGPANPTLTTQASAGVALGGQVTDTATLAGGTNPTGTIAFNLYGPNDATCAGAVAFTNTKTVTGNGQYTSNAFTPTVAGTYRWTASYSGDAGNTAVTAPCNAPNESVAVTGVGPANPTLSTQASAGVALGGAVTDTATLAGGTNPTGTITFNLFGPNDATCSTAAVFTNTKTVTGNGQYTSDPFTPTAAGTYRWAAAYSGDAGNTAVTSPCNAPNESVVVTGGAATPTLTSQASSGVPLGGQVTDTATLANGNNPTGTITFTLYGPDDATCAGAAVFTNTKTVAGNGSVASDPFTPTAVGTYRWVAAYSGDAGNNAVTSPCNAPNESVAVTSVTPGPSLTTQASRGVPVGNQIADVATLSNLNNPTGRLRFELFGPNNATCAGTPIFVSMIRVAGNGEYISTTFVPTQAGTYRWIASYFGDANNPALGPTACGDPNEAVVVSGPTGSTGGTGGTPGAVGFSSQATKGALGTPMADVATLAGGNNPSGRMRFALYGPGDATCTGTPVFASAVPVNGNGEYVSSTYVPTQAGTYRWVVSYSGDANNAAMGPTPCGDPAQTVTVA